MRASQSDHKSELGWIKARKYYELAGETKGSFDVKKKKGKVLRGYHYVVKSDGTWVHYTRMQEWVEDQEKTSQRG